MFVSDADQLQQTLQKVKVLTKFKSHITVNLQKLRK